MVRRGAERVLPSRRVRGRTGPVPVDVGELAALAEAQATAALAAGHAVPMPAAMRRAWPVAAAGAALGLLIIMIVLGPIGSHMVDLDVYRLGAAAWLAGDDIYTVHHAATGLLFTYPEFAAVVFIPFAVMPALLARAVMLTVSVVALWVVCHLTVCAVWPRLRTSAAATGAAGRADRLRWSVPLALAAVTAHPVLQTLSFGQINLVITALVLLDVLALPARQRGFLVGIAAGIKLVPAVFVVYFVVTGQRRAAARAIAAFAATLAVGFLSQPGPSWAFLTNYAWDLDRVGGIAYVTNQSILGITARLLREPHPSHLLTTALGGLVLVAALALCRRVYRRGDELTAVSVVAVAGLLASPVSWSHHWVWFIPCLGAFVIWVRDADRAGWRWLAFAVTTAIVWLGPMQFMPKSNLRELHHDLGQQIVANCYGALAVAFLVWAALRRTAEPARKTRLRDDVADRAPAPTA